MPPKAGEYQIPPGEHNEALDVPIYDEVSLAYENVQPLDPNSPLYYQERARQILRSESEQRERHRINGQATEIETARQYALDSTLFVLDGGNKAAWFGKIVKTLVGGNIENIPAISSPKELTHRELIQRESVIGAEVLGVPENGGQQTFFYSDAKEWVWHVVSADEKSSLTTRYVIQDNGILKIQDNAGYEYLAGEELGRFAAVTDVYVSHVMNRIYKTGHQLGNERAA